MKFNDTKNIATTHEGGRGYTKRDLDRLFNFMCGQFVGESKFYSDSYNECDSLSDLIVSVASKYGANFVAKMAVFARNVIGVRSSSHLAAAVLNGMSFDGKREFFKNICHRVDDVAEIMAAIDKIGGKRSHAMVRGCADYLATCTEYQIGKYKMNNRKYNLYDVINLTHATSSAINAYKNSTLETPVTWETQISAAGSDAELKNRTWLTLLHENKLGYMALIRNLSNIIDAIEYCGKKDDVNELCKQIINYDSIRKSLIFPYQIYTAYKQLDYEKKASSVIVKALESAFVCSIENMPELNGRNAIIVDLSASMEGRMSVNSIMTYIDISSVYAYALYSKNPDSVIVKFGDKAKLFKPSIVDDSPFSVIDKLKLNDGVGHCTHLNRALDVVARNGSFDRVFVFSDCQSADKSCYKDLIRIIMNKDGDTNLFLYNFDLGNYRYGCFDPDMVACLDYVDMTSLGDTAFKFIKYHELGEESFVDMIMNYKM